ncbi:MAG: hypothetical protein ACXWLH_06500 [Candidatus Saccharimonadales bacterium]
MSVRCTTEQAQEYIRTKHPDDREIPRNVNFRYMGNHFAAAVIFAAMGQPGQRHNLSELFVGFRQFAPKNYDELNKTPKYEIRTRAAEYIGWCERDARKRLASGDSADLLDAVDFEIANQWRMDDEPVRIFAVNSQGETAEVSHMGGFVLPTDRNWHFIEDGIRRGINREFPREV